MTSVFASPCSEFSWVLNTVGKWALTDVREMGCQAETLKKRNGILELPLDTESDDTAVAVRTEGLQRQLMGGVIWKPNIAH